MMSPYARFGPLLEMELPVTIRFGTTRMSLQDLLAVKTGMTIAFDRRLNDPVDILVNGKIVAKGEAVVVDGNYGLRILETFDRAGLPELEIESSNRMKDVEEIEA